MTPTVSFQSLPTELRLEIYDFLFADKDEQHYPHTLLEVTTKVKNECIPVLFPKLQMYIVVHYIQSPGNRASTTMERRQITLVLLGRNPR